MFKIFWFFGFFEKLKIKNFIHNMEPFDNNGFRESLVSNDNKRNPFKQLIIIIIVIIIFTAIAILGIIFLVKDSKEKISYSEILCLYKIDDISNEISILGNEYENIKNTIIKIYINETETNYNKTYNFNETGLYQIRYVLNENLIFDNIFKNIKNLEKVEMISNASSKILSMESSFEGCSNLNYISISGFDTKNLKSISKIFY